MHADIYSYFDNLPPERAEALQRIRNIVLQMYPEARESMTYKMPTYEVGDNWLAIGNHKHHYAIYTCSTDVIQPYLDKHDDVSAGKGCLRFKDKHELAENDLKAVIVRAMNQK